MLETTPLLGTLMGLAAYLLAIALFVQIIQELLKFLRSGESRVYTMVLGDLLGPWARHLTRPGVLPDLQVRGPFQFLRLRPRGVLLPLDREALVGALEKTAAPRIRRTLEALRQESKLQAGKPQASSPSWLGYLDELLSVGRGSPGYRNARQVSEFLAEWGVLTKKEVGEGFQSRNKAKHLDAAETLSAFRHRFLAHVIDADQRYPQLMRNFEYAYRRRNMLSTFIIGIAVALLFNFPFDRIYQRAASLSAEQRVELAERAIATYERLTPENDEAKRQEAEELKSLAIEAIEIAAGRDGSIDYLGGWNTVRQYWEEGGRSGWILTLRYFFGCLITAVLVSFGAPFWHDLAKALLRLQQGRRTRPRPEAGEATNG